MSFLDHLEDLSWHLIRATFSILLIASLHLFLVDLFLSHHLCTNTKWTFQRIICYAKLLNH